MNNYVSDAVVKRLPRYRRYLKRLQEAGIKRISSKELGEIMEVTASQIRQDLNHFGGFGQQGYGYSVSDLVDRLEEIIGIDKTYKVGIIGCGRLGQSIMSYLRYEPAYKVVALCDKNKEKVGQKIDNLVVEDMEQFSKTIAKGIDILILTIPSSNIDEVNSMLAGTKVKGVWNFSRSELKLKGREVVNVHLSDSLNTLCYYMNHQEN